MQTWQTKPHRSYMCRLSYAIRLFKNRLLDFLPKPVKRQDIERVMNEYIRVFGKRRAAVFEYGIGRTRFRVAEEEIVYF